MVADNVPILRATLAAGVFQYGSIRKLGAALEVPPSTLHDWISGRVVPSRLTQRALWAALDGAGVTVAWEVKTESEADK